MLRCPEGKTKIDIETTILMSTNDKNRVCFEIQLAREKIECLGLCWVRTAQHVLPMMESNLEVESYVTYSIFRDAVILLQIHTDMSSKSPLPTGMVPAGVQ